MTKIAIISILCFLFAIGLGMISSLIDERENYHQEVIQELKEAHIREQAVITPFLLLQNQNDSQILFADSSSFDVNASVSNDEYQRGIYHAISYHGQIKLLQTFDMQSDKTVKITPQKSEVTQQNSKLPKINQASNNPSKKLSLIVAISDLRGVQPTEVIIGEKTYPVKFTKDASLPFAYLEADLSELLKQPIKTISTDLSISISGIDGIKMMPLGGDFAFSLKSNWNEPKFFGGALPYQKNMTNQGFTANWQADFIAQENEAALIYCLQNNEKCPNVENTDSDFKMLNTAFVQVNDTYAQTNRAAKYALLLILVSFGTFFLFETLKGLRIHPVQYGLVASVLLVFYVLLLSLAEYVVFGVAYLIASVSCVALLGFYTSYVLNTKKRGIVFSLIVGSLYGMFYIILSVSGYNLLLGSVFCFLLIAAVMFMTRNINWYEINTNRGQKTTAQPNNIFSTKKSNLTEK